jgi:riboflavin kinase/FMN adenylyltransferase
LGERAGIRVHLVDSVLIDLAEGRERVSSTLVRNLLRAGRVEDVRRCLGREFVLYGTVVGGRGRGRLLEFPTANLGGGEQVVPGDGVYAGRALVRGRTAPAAISVGTKPTFGESERTVEAFLLDAREDYYNEPVGLSFVRRLRDQVRFDSAEALKAQIAKDVEIVRQIVR